MEPQCRALPVGRGGAFPDRADAVRVGDQPQLRGRGEHLGEPLGAVGQRPPEVTTGGRPGGSGLVKGCQEGGQDVGRVRSARGGGAVGRLARHSGGDAGREANSGSGGRPG